MRFLAPRVSGAFPLRGFGDAVRAGHSWPISFGPTYRTRARDCYRDLTGTVKVPATPMGFTNTLRSFASVRG
jgi:hypothetical protein